MTKKPTMAGTTGKPERPESWNDPKVRTAGMDGTNGIVYQNVCRAIGVSLTVSRKL
jgi:hypothetical protein